MKHTNIYWKMKIWRLRSELHWWGVATAIAVIATKIASYLPGMMGDGAFLYCAVTVGIFGIITWDQSVKYGEAKVRYKRYIPK